MTSNKNSPQKNSGSNQPDKKQSIDSDAANVDWMIMSDLSTRIGGYSEPQQQINNSSNTKSPQASNNQFVDDDLEDLEWLRSLGLDEPIGRSPSPKDVASSGQNINKNNDAVDDIDWLIVSDIKTRMVQPENTPPSSGQPNINILNQDNQDDQEFQFTEESNGLDLILNEDLGLDEFDFSKNSDFADLNSLGLDNSNDFSSNELQNDLDITEGKIRDLSKLFDNSFDLDNSVNNSFDLDNSVNNTDDWDQVLGDFEDSSSQISSSSNLGIIEESLEIPTQITGFIDNVNHHSELLANDPIEGLNIEEVDNGFADFLFSEELTKLNGSLEDSDSSNNSQDFLDQGLDDLQVADTSDFEDIDDISDQVWAEDIHSEAFADVDDKVDKINDISEHHIHDVFANNWEQSNVAHKAIDDSIWDASAHVNPELVSSTAIANAFGTLDDWVIASQSDQLVDAAESDDDWSADLEAEINADISGDLNWGLDSDAALITDTDSGISIDDDFQPNSQSNFQPSEETEVIISNDIGNDVQIDENYNEVQDIDELEPELEFDLQAAIAINDDKLQESSNNDFGSIEPDQSSEWGAFSDSFAQPITDSDFDDDFANAIKSMETIPPINPINLDVSSLDVNLEKTEVSINQNLRQSSDIQSKDFTEPEELQNVDEFAGLESIIDEDFDLADFDEEFLPEIPSANVSGKKLTTTLAPNRAVPPPLTAHPQDLTPSVPPPVLPVKDSFAKILTNDAINNAIDNAIDEYDLEVDLHEEALANDLLNGYTSESDLVGNLDNPMLGKERISPPLPNLVSPVNFDMDTSDSDFLDDFDLDSLDTQITGDDFGSAFTTPAVISTSLTPLIPPVPPIVPSIDDQDVTSPTINNPPPPPPPFLPPLPPKRPAQTKQPPLPAPAINKSANKPINTIDEGWSELLDADTVLSGVLPSPTGSPQTNSRSSTPSNNANNLRGVSGTTGTGNSTGSNMGSNMGSSAARSSQGRERDYNSFTPPKRKDTGLPDFNDLGLEIHDDNTDWSGLLDSEDLSDSITSISTGSQLPSRGRTAPTPPPRSDMTGTSETREIPRDRRRPPISGFDATQARMAAMPDQIDFNRFTDDRYDYEPPASPPAVVPPAKTQKKLTMPSVSLESLWQDYLKIPVIGLGAIGTIFLLYSFLNKPVFDTGLRWGIFKDASGKDFTNADFRGAKLDNVDFSKAILTGAKMQDASLVGANFTGAKLDGVNFTNANLNRARLIQASIVWAEFNKAQMNLVDLEGADLTLSNFANAKMEGTNLLKSKIGAQGTNKATKFSPTLLLAWQIVNEPREGRNLAEQDLSGLNLSFSNLKRANLSNSKLNYTDLTGTDLRGANLTGSQVNGANLSAAKLAGINLTDVAFDASKLPKTDEETICPNNKKGPCKF